MAMPESSNVVTVTQLGKVLNGYNDKINTKLGNKADKVSNATSGNFAGLDANGNLTDSGKKAADFKTKQTAVSDPTAGGTSVSFIATASQDTNGVITVTKKSVPTAVATGASGATDGLMTANDKQKLDNIETGAEVNQNAFSNVKVGNTTVAADTKTDTIEFVGSGHVTITGDSTNDKVTFSTDLESKAAASGGTAVSLVTTGEKYTWNSKADGTHTHNTAIASDSSSGTVVSLNANTQYKLTAGGTSVLFKTPADSDTHRTVKVNGTQALGNNTTALDLIAGNNVSITDGGSGKVTIANTYAHPTYTAADAAAKKIGRDATGHVVIGDALAKGDVGLGNVDNTSDATKKSNFTGSVASGNTGFPTGGAVYTAIANNGKGIEFVTYDETPYSEISSIINAGKLPVLEIIVTQGGGTVTGYLYGELVNYELSSSYTFVIINQTQRILCTCTSSGWSTTTENLEFSDNKVTSWSSSTTNTNYPSEKLVKDSLDTKVDKVSGKGLSTNDYTTTEKNKLAGIAAGAEVNQNAFSKVKVGSTTVEADSKTDTLELVAGSGVTLTPDATNDKITITATGTTYGGDRGISLVDGKFGHSNTAITAGSVGPTAAATSTSVTVPSITYDAYGHITAASNKTFTVQNASTSQKGIVQLSDAINSTSSTTAATSKAVNDAIADVMSKVNARAMFFESQAAWETYIAGEGQTGDPSKVYYVKVGTGDDKYDVYVWKTETSGGSYVKVDESSISLDGYWHGTPTSSGSGNVVTAITLGNDGSVTYTKGITALTEHQTVTNNNATIGTSLTTIATIGGTDIKAKIGSYAAASHTHGNITNDGKIGSTANLSVVTGTSGAVTTADLTVSSPSVPSSGTTTSLEFIDTVSQGSNGQITATKKKVLVDSTYSSTGTNPVNGTAVAAAIGGLDAAVTSTDGTNVQVKVTETNGKITAVNVTTDNTENKNNKVVAWSSTTTDEHYPSEKLVKSALDNKSDKTATVSTVAYDTTNKKITKTINGSTSDVVTAAKIVTDGGGITSHQTIVQDGITGATINRYASCSTAAATAAKTASITTGTFALNTGTRVTVKFANANTASTPTLNINSTGAKNIFSKGVQITTGNNKALLAGAVDFIYDGTQWNLVGNYIDTSSVTGVKGSAESTYRAGDVELTPANLGISATTTSVTVGSTTFNKYVHPTFTSATAAAVKVGRDTDGHVVLGSALTKADVGIVEMTDAEVTAMLEALT